MAVEIILYGHDADGGLYEIRHDAVYPGWMPLDAVAGAIGAWAIEQGFFVQYPTPETVTISWDDSSIGMWSAGAYPWVTDAGTPAGHVRFDAR